MSPEMSPKTDLGERLLVRLKSGGGTDGTTISLTLEIAFPESRAGGKRVSSVRPISDKMFCRP